MDHEYHSIYLTRRHPAFNKVWGIREQGLDDPTQVQPLEVFAKSNGVLHAGDLPTEKVWVAGQGIVHRRGSCAVTYKGDVYMFGGLDNNNKDHNDLLKCASFRPLTPGLYYYAFVRWSPEHPEFQEVTTDGPRPSARWTAAAAVHKDNLYVFGGFYGYGDQDTGYVFAVNPVKTGHSSLWKHSNPVRTAHAYYYTSSRGVCHVDAFVTIVTAVTIVRIVALPINGLMTSKEASATCCLLKRTT
eukprot:9153458-Pyramimonas_sp.AAC.1